MRPSSRRATVSFSGNLSLPLHCCTRAWVSRHRGAGCLGFAMVQYCRQRDLGNHEVWYVLYTKNNRECSNNVSARAPAPFNQPGDHRGPPSCAVEVGLPLCWRWVKLPFRNTAAAPVPHTITILRVLLLKCASRLTLLSLLT